MPGSKVLALGIDVGTSKCCVAGMRNGAVEVYENERCQKTTPSLVAFTETARLVGDPAKDQWTVNPQNTVYGVKRFIGRPYDEIGIAKINLPFVVNDRGNPCIEVTYKDEPMKLLPEQILAMLLAKMKRTAEINLGYKVDKAVISVPTSFDMRQRQATMDAATIAGLDVLELINEPTAAAIAYMDQIRPRDESLLVFDYGGGTIDSGAVKIQGRNLELLSAYGEPTMGGLELDILLANHYAEEFSHEKRYKVDDNVKSMTKLRLSCEKQKHTLSLLPSVPIQIDCLVNGIDLSSSITRDRFKMDVCGSYLHHKVLPAIDSAVELSAATKVLLVGGSSRLPFVQEHLKKSGKVLDKSVNMDEAVAHGAALRAALLAGDNEVPDLFVEDAVKQSVVPDHARMKPFIDQENGFRQDEEDEHVRTVAMADLERACFDCNDLNLREEVLDWISENPMATKEEYIEKRKLVAGKPVPVTPSVKAGPVVASQTDHNTTLPTLPTPGNYAAPPPRRNTASCCPCCIV